MCKKVKNFLSFILPTDDFVQYKITLCSSKMTQHWSLEFLKFLKHQLPSAVQIKDPNIECDSATSNLNELTEEILIDSKSVDLTEHYEPPVQNNNVGESLYCDNRENEVLQLELQEANEQCRCFKTKLEAATGELTKANELLNAEKMFRSKVEIERDSLAWLAEKLELVLLKYDQHFSCSGKITLCYSKITHRWSLKNVNSVTHLLPFDVQIKEPKSESDCVKTEITEEILIKPKLEDLTEYYDYEPSMQNNFADESFCCDNRDKKMANEQCRCFKIQFEAVNEELTKINDSLNAEKMFRSKAEIDRDSLAHLVEKLELILLKYDQYFSSAGKIVESSEFFDVNLRSELDLKIKRESDADCVSGSSCPAPITIVKDEIADEIDNTDAVSLSCIKSSNSSDEINGTHAVSSTSIKTGGLFIQKESILKTATSNQRNYNTRGIKQEADLLNSGLPNNPEVRFAPVTNNSPSCKKDSGFYCVHCDKKFPKKCHLIRHIRARHLPESKKPCKCTTCGKSFTKQSHLKRHQAVHIILHKKGSNLQCNICKQNFSSKRGLWNHQRIVHDGVKPFKCRTCNKKFADKTDLKVHEPVHSSERPFQCSFCNKSFKTDRQTRLHERIIHGDGGFHCAHCDKKYEGKRDLIHHIMAKHLKLGKQYSCRICGKVFPYERNKRRHERELHGKSQGVLFSCEHCEKEYRHRRVLLMHIKKFH